MVDCSSLAFHGKFRHFVTIALSHCEMNVQLIGHRRGPSSAFHGKFRHFVTIGLPHCEMNVQLIGHWQGPSSAFLGKFKHFVTIGLPHCEMNVQLIGHRRGPLWCLILVRHKLTVTEPEWCSRLCETRREFVVERVRTGRTYEACIYDIRMICVII
ncbi:hypothetical protein AVEN_232419-1 [Araneus ventricosus]|uniref:Uncharacterized protein n=1 Tax=Araneus ventricosus TaxID=182803 RepID=A0A4Y2P676_ARAVE|nr:hypothetical protein AVEN_232419-1 [Araneus ventricosus]